jgi:DNA modification methylase
VNLNKEQTYNWNPKIFKTKNVGNVWEIPFNSGKNNDYIDLSEFNKFGRKETKSNYGHSGFPIQIPETCILLSTNENDVVLDMFMGTGQTGIACKNTKRKFIGIEMDTNNFNLAKHRIEQSNNLFNIR